MSSVLHCSGYELVKTDITHGQGCYLYDTRGNKYLDFEAGDWGAALGHSHPRINQVIREQAERLMHIGFTYTTQEVENAASAVLDMVGIENGKCVYLSSGSEAVEFGVQLALRISDKPKLFTMVDSFLASYGSAGTKPPDQWFCFDCTDCHSCPQSSHCDSECELISAIPFDEIAAWVFEPGSSSGLIRFPPKGFLRVLEKSFREKNVIVIANEVTTGMGRTGLWFGHQQYDLKPDMVALGKGIGNGYPVSAVALTKEIANRLEDSGFRYAQSHQNDPLGCAVAEAVINTMKQEEIIDKCRVSGEYFISELQRLTDEYDQIAEVRGRGLMAILQFDPECSARTVFLELLKRGYIVGIKAEQNLIRFLPPLILTQQEIDDFMGSLEAVLICMN